MSVGADQDWEAMCRQIPHWKKLAQDAEEQTPAGDGGQRMTARTTSQRQADYIANKQRQGLKQIRNLWAKPEDHAKVREFVAKLNSA